MTGWRHRWHSDGRTLDTADAAWSALVEDEGGVAERASDTAENAVMALSRLVKILHDSGRLTTDEITYILDLHGFEPEGK